METQIRELVTLWMEKKRERDLEEDPEKKKEIQKSVDLFHEIILLTIDNEQARIRTNTR